MTNMTITEENLADPATLRDAREKRGLSQEKLARSLGVSYATVHRWENGHVRVPPAYLPRLKNLLVDPPPTSESVLEAVVRFGSSVLSAKRQSFLNLFGAAGTGKTTLALRVVETLALRFDISVVHVNLGELVGLRTPPEALQDLEDLNRSILAEDHRALVLVLDELDAASELQFAGRATVLFWIMSILKRLRDAVRPALVMGVTRDPSSIDPAIRSLFGGAFYVGPPSKAQIVAILRRANIDRAPKVAEEYFDLCERYEEVSMLRPLVYAVEEITQRTTGQALRDLSPIALAELLHALGPPIPAQSLRQFEESNSSWIAASRCLIERVLREP
jgi:DNA-binding XRE family transcriptional regulator